MPALVNHLFLIPLAPLLGAVVLGFFGSRLGRANVALIGCSTVFISWIGSLSCFSVVAAGISPAQTANWFHVGSIQLSAGLGVDRLSAVMLLVVTGVGLLIHIYSTAYMAEDPAQWRFFAYLNLFVGAMLILVLATNLVLMFVGWEGVGLCSYLLIGFWYQDEEKARAGKKAFIVNRVGDFGFILAVFALLALFGTVDFTRLRLASGALPLGIVLHSGVFAGWTGGGVITLICLLLLLGVAGKSAQIPLYVWLPDAMAGPTPVSALIHAATMVTAGIYLTCRLAFLFALSPTAMVVLASVGAATALFAAVIATAQTDIKKVVAYSTISQLGFMALGVGAGAYWAAIFHLVTHACFKALLFLGAGSVIHGLHDEQDLRKMGCLAKRLPHTAIAMAVATAAITGVLPLSGFFSKDAILGMEFGEQNQLFPWAPHLLYAVGTLAAFGTAFYMGRLFWLTFAGEPRSPAAEHAHEAPPAMTLITYAMAALSILTVALGLPSEEGPWLERFLAPFFNVAIDRAATLTLPPEHGVPWGLYESALAIAWAGFALSIYWYLGRGKEVPARLRARAPTLFRVVENKFYVDEIYNAIFVVPLLSGSRLIWRVIDVGLIDTLFVRGLGAVLKAFSLFVLKPLQNGNVQRYAAVLALGATALLWRILL